MATTSTPAVDLSIDFNGNEAQEAFVRDRNKETTYIGGVGSGKTVAGIMRLARHIFEWNPGEQLAVVAPTVPMLRNVIIPEMRRWGLLNQPGIEHRRSENVVQYPNGTTLILESANNARKIERLRGLNLAAAWLDEVAQHQHRTYSVLGDRLRTGNYRNLFATGTPKGKNWVWDDLIDIDVIDTEAVADGTLIRDDHTTSIYGVSTEANRANPDDYIESRKRNHTGQSYEQEILGKFTTFDGLIYRWFDSDNLVDPVDPDGIMWDETVYGVDWGHNNPSTALAIIRWHGLWIVAEEWYETRRTVNHHSSQVQDMIHRWGPGRVYCDPSEPANIDQFNRDGIDARKARNDVMPGIQHITSLRDELRIASNCQNLRNEFGQYQYKDDTDKPEKHNDHALDALRYALFSHKRPGSKQSRVFSIGF